MRRTSKSRMLAGAGGVDDRDVMRAGAASEVFGVRVRADAREQPAAFSLGDIRSLEAPSL